jgi:long-chain acyl-CoA synthetase
MANALQALGVKKGDRVAIYVGNIPEFIVAFFANCKIGAISVPFNTMLKGMEIEYILNNSESKILFGMAAETEQNILPILGQIPSLEKIISVRGMAGGGSNPNILAFEKLLADNSPEFKALDLAETDAVTLLYTSGTTGRPKGALSTHASWTYQAAMNAGFAVQITDEDLVLTGAPFFHVYVVMTVLPTLYAGGTVVALQRFFAKDTLALITKHKVTHFMGTPTMWAYLIEEFLKHKDLYDVSSLRLGQCAGAPLAGELGRQIQQVFGVGLVECYGSTESASTVTHTRFGHYKPGTPGRPLTGWEIKIVNGDGKEMPEGEIGELWCKGPGIVREYWNDPDMTATKIKDGWWKSGDLAYVKGPSHADCELYIVDRKDDMLVCGGYNIYPSEVESYLVQHPKVLQAIVIGIPDPLKGEIPKAFVVLSPDQEATAEEIIQWSKENMAAYKAPRQVEITTIDDLPKTATGKILKRELKRMEAEK